MALDVPKLVTALQALYDTSTTLQTDQAAFTAAIETIEHAVNVLAIGIEVRIELPPTRSGAPIWLGYGRIWHGVWGFLVWEDETCWAYTDAPRWLRLRTLASFPRLLERLRDAANDLIAEIEQATKTAREFADAVKIGLAR